MTIEESFQIPGDHPALTGHFPGNPIVPGVVLLEQALDVARRHGLQVSELSAVRFKSPLRGGTPCLMRISVSDDSSVRLTCLADGTTVMTATLARHEAAPEP